MLDRIGFRQSFSTPGCPYDNAIAEAFFKFLKKKEEINRRRFSQIEEVKQSLFSYIEVKNGLMKLTAGFLLMRKKQNFGEKISEKFIYFTLSCPLY